MELRFLLQWELVQTLKILLWLIDIHSAKTESITYANVSDSQSTQDGDFQFFSTCQLAQKKENEVANLVIKNEFFPWELFFCIASMVQQLQKLISVGSAPACLKNKIGFPSHYLLPIYYFLLHR